MISSSGRFVLAFNGEIYNHMELRKELQCVVGGDTSAWRGDSDTETLLLGFEAWGIKETIVKSVGMFALAVWDRQLQRLTLGRDRLGEKPLYYGWQGSGAGATFLFGSELKALKAHPSFSADIDRGALCLLMRHNYIPAPYSIYQQIRKLLPGNLLTVSTAQRDLEPETYWSAMEMAVRGVANPFGGGAEEAVVELEVLLKSAVQQQMAADVPLGAFLSGGIDSSTIVALMQTQSSRAVKTFTVGFNEAGFNEAIYAKAVAKHLGTDHTELYITPQQALDVIPLLPKLYCEPFADSSAIPTFLLSKLARRHVTVSLSGDAGDELFCGYSRYLLAHTLWRRLSSVPPSLRRFASTALTSVPPNVWSSLISPLQKILPASFQQVNWGDKLYKGARVMALDSHAALYLGLVSHWEHPASVVLGATEPTTILTNSRASVFGLDNIQRMMALDSLTYLPDDVLVKVDRAAMGVSLESRAPFLDHRVVEFAWRLPQSLKLRDGEGKWILRQVLRRHLPKELIERPKMGFGIPLGAWLRGPLKDWAEDLLDETRLLQEGYFHPAPIRQKWREHLSGRRNWQDHLWGVLMFQSWLELENSSR